MSAREEFLTQLGRTADRLRSMTINQLERDDRITKIRSFLSDMAGTTHPGVAVPELLPTALGDQLLVIGREFAGTSDEDSLQQSAERLREFRKTL